MNKRHFWSIFTTTHTLFRSNKAFCIDLFSLFAPKQTSVNNTNRIINAGIFSVYASTQMNYLWRLDWETFTFPSYAKECFLHLSITEVIRIFLCKRGRMERTLSRRHESRFTCNFSFEAFCWFCYRHWGERLNLNGWHSKAANLISSRLGVRSSVRKKAPQKIL